MGHVVQYLSMWSLCTVRGYGATTVRCYNLSLLLCGGTAQPRYAAISTSLRKSIVPCGGTGLRRYAVPSLLIWL